MDFHKFRCIWLDLCEDYSDYPDEEDDNDENNESGEDDVDDYANTLYALLIHYLTLRIEYLIAMTKGNLYQSHKTFTLDL
jgi:hypothetical protein